MSQNDLDAYMHELVGQRCEGVDNPVGSVLRLDIGPLGLGPRDEPDSARHGWRHLTIKSPWRLQDTDEFLCDWNLCETDGAALSACIGRLVGQTIQDAEVDLPGSDLRIRWSNNLLLIVFADSNEDRDDAWFILGTDGLELTAGPVKQGYKGWRARWIK